MMKQSTYNKFISGTISTICIHYLLILIEYLFFIAPSTINASIKLFKFNHNKMDFLSSTTINIHNFIIIKYINEAQLVSIIIASIALFAIIIYYFIIFLGFPKHDNKWFEYIELFLINFFDIIVFRYLSLFIIDSYLWLFLQYFLKKTIIGTILSLFILFVLLFFIYTSYSFIKNNAVLINISNSLLVNSNIKEYPYDYFSMKYEFCMLLLKTFISSENCYFLTTEIIDAVVISLNVIIVILNVILFMRFSIINLYTHFNISFFFANTKLNCLRNFISIFNFILTIGIISIYSNNYSYLLLGLIIFISINTAIIFSYIHHHIIIPNHLVTQPINYESILLMMISDFKSNEFQEKYTKIQYHSFLKHRSHCKEDDCNLCLNFSYDLQKNLKVFYKYLKQKREVSPYEKTVTLLYYKITKKPFKYFRYYYWLSNKYNQVEPEYVKNIRMMAETWLLTENDDYCCIIEDLLYITQLETKLNHLIKGFSTFLDNNIKLKRPETIIQLSKDLSCIMKKVKLFVIETHKKMNNCSFMDNMSKSIHRLLHYNSIIIRYVIECLINHPLHGLAALNIENHDDLFNEQFDRNQTLICSIDLKSVSSFSDIILLKVTGRLSRKNNHHNHHHLSDLFAKELIQEGYQILYDQINKKNSSNSDIKYFQFPFLYRGTIEYMKYSFRLMKTLRLNTIIIYGQYTKDKDQYLLLNRKDLSKIEILSFCSKGLKLIHFKRKWIPYLNQINFQFFLHTIFKSVKINDAANVIECILDYKYYLKKITQLHQDLRTLESFKENESNEMHLKNSIEEMKKLSSTMIKVTLVKICDYSLGKILYQMNMKTKIAGTNLEQIEDEKNGDCNGDHNEDALIYQYHSTTMSSTSMSRGDSSLQNQGNNSKNSSEFLIRDQDLKEKIEKQTKNLSLFFWIMIILNLALVFICAIFLKTQYTKTTQLSQLSEIFYQVKTLRLFTMNFYISFAMLACYSPVPNEEVDCVNKYIEYSETAKIRYNVPSQFDFFEYMERELLIKTDKAKETLLSFKDLLYSYPDDSMKAMLLKQIQYYDFDQSGPQQKSVINFITFEEGLRQYINTIFQLSHESVSFRTVPLYFITLFNGTFLLNNLPTKPASLTQILLYKGFMNYINLYYNFEESEKEISKEVNFLKSENNIMNIIFMIIVAVLNGLLFVLCIRNVQSSYKLFETLILNFVFKIEDITLAKALYDKLNILASLLCSYEKNPNDLIKKITISNATQQTHTNTIKIIKKHPNNGVNTGNNVLSLNATFDSSFFSSLVGRFILICCVLFGFFFVVIIILDCVLSIYFTSVFSVFDYVILHFTIENNIMIQISFASFMHVCNITDRVLSMILQIETPFDGVLNNLVRETFVEYQRVTDYMNIDPKQYPSFENDVDYSCEKIFYSFSDYFMNKTISEVGKDFRLVSTNICIEHQLLNAPAFAYIRTDMLGRIQMISNKKQTNDYENVYMFATDNTFYELLTITFLIFRPLSSFFRTTVLQPTLTKTFGFYVTLVGIYLCINIILEILLVIIVSICITRKLTKIQNNLFLLTNCLN